MSRCDWFPERRIHVDLPPLCADSPLTKFAVCGAPCFELRFVFDVFIVSMTIRGKESDSNNPGLRIEWGACGHGFHQSCIMDWSKTHPTCPKCNAQWEKSRVETVGFGCNAFWNGLQGLIDGMESNTNVGVMVTVRFWSGSLHLYVGFLSPCGLCEASSGLNYDFRGCFISLLSQCL